MAGTTSEVVLPDEILLLVSTELGQDRDFGTIFAWAQASKSFAEQALRTLYRSVSYGVLYCASFKSESLLADLNDES